MKSNFEVLVIMMCSSKWSKGMAKFLMIGEKDAVKLGYVSPSDSNTIKKIRRKSQKSRKNIKEFFIY